MKRSTKQLDRLDVSDIVVGMVHDREYYLMETWTNDHLAVCSRSGDNTLAGSSPRNQGD
ncbi:MAG: hypothetical protein QM753_09330 [Thermomicrobiales bacterium]